MKLDEEKTLCEEIRQKLKRLKEIALEKAKMKIAGIEVAEEFLNE